MPRGSRIQWLIGRLAACNRLTAESGRWLAALLLCLMLVTVMMQVIFRYLLNDSLIWTEEIAKSMMVWAAFLVAPFAWRRGSNVAITMLVDPLAPRASASIRLLINGFVLWMLAVFLQASFGFVSRGLAINAASLEVPMAVFYAIVPVSLGAMILVGCELLLRDVMTLLDPQGSYAIAAIAPIREGE